MTIPRIRLSSACERTSPPAISSLMQTALAHPGLISLAAGFVDQKSLPVEAAARAVSALLADEREGRRALQYGATNGDTGLRTRLITQLEQQEEVAAGTFRDAVPLTVVTTGSAQLIYLVAEALLDPGDIVLVESPTYFVFLSAMETRGARVIGVETDDGGMRLDALEATLAELKSLNLLDRVKLVYLVTEHANPTGNSLAESRRLPLLELVRKWSESASQRIFILEDAAYRGLIYSGNEPPSLWGQDPSGETVILARTFSKTFAPGLKTGYGILPHSLVEPVLRLKGNHDFGSAHFGQLVLERVLADGSYDRHVEGLVALYRRKRDVLLAALDEHFGPLADTVSWSRPKGGLFVWLRLPDGLDTGPDGPLFARALAEGVLYVPGAYAFAEEPGPVPRNYARLCFGVPSAADLSEGIRRLAVALVECLDPVA